MAVETDIVVGRKVDASAAVDHCFRAGDPFVHTEERISDPEKLRRFADHADFSKSLKRRDIETGRGNIVRIRVAVA